MVFTLDQVVPWGRTFEEYEAMFALTPAELGGRILGCGDGPASFNAEGAARGVEALSCDPLYLFSPGQIRRRVEESYPVVMRQVHENRDGFVWSAFRSPEHLGEVRLLAMRRFLAHYDTAEGRRRYVAAALPALPFAGGAFDLALCSHFLFLYSQHHDLAFHVASLRELGRVAREVRIFPLLDLARNVSAHLEPAMERLRAEGWRVERVRVGYEFQRGGDEMLSLSAPAR